MTSMTGDQQSSSIDSQTNRPVATRTALSAGTSFAITYARILSDMHTSSNYLASATQEFNNQLGIDLVVFGHRRIEQLTRGTYIIRAAESLTMGTSPPNGRYDDEQLLRGAKVFGFLLVTVPRLDRHIKASGIDLCHRGGINKVLDR